MSFAAEGLPPGLVLDARTGIISGKADGPGAWRATLAAKNSRGKTKRQFRVVVGNTLALTPPMGWNSWYIHYDRVSDALMRQAADQMIDSGMADYGYQYVNIDDCWMKKQGDEPYRDANGAVLPNAKFPDMGALAAYVHGKGLKAGLYTSPGPWTCGGYAGRLSARGRRTRGNSPIGALIFSNTIGAATGRWPKQNHLTDFKVLTAKCGMNCASSIATSFSISANTAWAKFGTGAAKLGNCWRTTGDLGLEPGSRLPGFYSIAFSNARHWQFAKPGGWNDPDYILIGWVGDAHGMGPGQAHLAHCRSSNTATCPFGA